MKEQRTREQIEKDVAQYQQTDGSLQRALLEVFLDIRDQNMAIEAMLRGIKEGRAVNVREQNPPYR